MARALGFDFGTTNSVIAEAVAGETRSMRFSSAAGEAESMRTALSFLKNRDSSLHVEAGQAAIRQFIDNPGDCRFLQSIKTFAASPLFQATLIFARRNSFEDLMSAFVERLKTYAGEHWPEQPGRLVVGRPVAFAGANPDEELALTRYGDALRRSGFADIHYVYEPVAAAFYFARKLREDATVLVADFGGGTTDYSLIRFEHRAGRLTAEPVGHSGVGVAGDHFDFRIIDQIVSPEIGKAAPSAASTRSSRCRRAISPISAAGTSCRSSRPRRNSPNSRSWCGSPTSRKSSKPLSIWSIMTRAFRSTSRCHR